MEYLYRYVKLILFGTACLCCVIVTHVQRWYTACVPLAYAWAPGNECSTVWAL
jgi:hypothetical protein